ncbi:MAG: phosphatase PAP2 family protein [Candidatus Parcubacteria bacterium]|nr:phosphatase PAP2 family protein [Candidatus Parcubacteria bacterium]
MLFNLSQKKLVFASLFSAIILILITWLVKISPALQSFDDYALAFFAQGRCPFSNAFFLAITYLGNTEFLVSFSFFLSIVFYFYKKLPYYIIFIGTIIGSSAFVYILKDIVERARPSLIAPVYQETSLSFPSGHAALSVIFYGMLAYFFARNTKIKQVQQNLLAGWIFLFVFIGYSRLHLGVHFVSDVIAGYATGFFWLSLGILLFEQLISEELPWWKRCLNKLKQR